MRTWDELDLSRIDEERARRDDGLFLLVCAASFIESGADTYSRNLVEMFGDDADVGTWLAQHWQREELRHGDTLKSYLQRVWPEFEWDRAYAGFFDEYSKEAVWALEPTRGQEMASRCVVEMGTTTYYQALGTIADEPVLRDILRLIRADEVRHYKHFYSYFLRYRSFDRLPRPRVLAALVRRVLEMRRNDGEIALRHAAAWRFRGRPRAELTALCARATSLLGRHYPAELAVRMALKPLRLPPSVQRRVERPLTVLTRRAILRA